MASRHGLSRRSLALGPLMLLGGCGFRPLYAPAASGAAGPASAELAAIYVPVMQERAGQLLRQALQQRLEGSGAGTAKKYELIAYISVGSEGIGIQPDNAASRVRLTGAAPWTLRALSPERPVVVQGNSRVLDGFNIANQQYFAAELDNEAAVRRIASALADQIVVQVAAHFQRQAAPG